MNYNQMNISLNLTCEWMKKLSYLSQQFQYVWKVGFLGAFPTGSKWAVCVKIAEHKVLRSLRSVWWLAWVRVSKTISSIPLFSQIFTFVNTLISCYILRSYLTDIFAKSRISVTEKFMDRAFITPNPWCLSHHWYFDWIPNSIKIVITIRN